MSETLPMVTLDDVRRAHERIRTMVVHTPAVRCPALDAIAGAELWLKAENLQRIGAFKARGALHAVLRLTGEQRRRGIITYSSGNHAQAVALAAQTFGCACDIAMPVDAPEVKLEVVRSLGARVVLVGTTSEERKQAALALQAESGGVIIPPFDDPDIVAGAGTATLELLEDVQSATDGGQLDALLVPVGGGGLIAGACVATTGTPTRVFSVEPTGCDAMRASLERGERVAVEPGPTLADGLKPTLVGELNFRIAKARLTGSFLVDDDEMGRALVRLLFVAKILVEPSGAAALAVALRGGTPQHGDRGLGEWLGVDHPRIGVLLSGGNVAPRTVADLVSRYAG
jgi:threonine dehydratase